MHSPLLEFHLIYSDSKQNRKHFMQSLIWLEIPAAASSDMRRSRKFSQWGSYSDKVFYEGRDDPNSTNSGPTRKTPFKVMFL